MSKSVPANPFHNWTPQRPELQHRILTKAGVLKRHPWKHWTPERPELLIRLYPRLYPR